MKKARNKFSIEGKPLYPHIKLTRERFPRVFATRLIADDDAEYFGAFLNRTNARILVDFLNRTFRLRSCEIDIDGSFNYPCTMYYKRRCWAPCVSDLIGEAEYAEMISLVRLFLLNDRELLRSVLRVKIDAASERLDFEAAGKWRDILTAVEDYWNNSRWDPWTDKVSDTFQIAASAEGFDVFLISQKGRRVMGERVFSFPGSAEEDGPVALADVIEQFYRSHAPKEIRVPIDFERRRELQKLLSQNFGRRVPIVLLSDKNRKVSTERAIRRSSAELDVRRIAAPKSPNALAEELQTLFELMARPRRICAVDVAHISGTNQVAAAVGWADGRSDNACAGYLLASGTSEIGALSEFVAMRFAEATHEDLVLIDGGIAQLNAASKTGSNAAFIAAVKPAGRHGEISHFLTPGGTRIDFDPASEAMLLLLRLRDEVHEFANTIHRDVRDFAPFYELAGALPFLTEPERQRLLSQFGSRSKVIAASEKEIAKVLGVGRAQVAAADLEAYRKGRSQTVYPLIVPVRFQEANGAAEDLRPIEAGEKKPR